MPTIFKYYKGFTLSEVIIVIGIIGIVAVMTIPTLINFFENEQYKQSYKKAYSTISQAFITADSQDLIIENNSNADNRANFIAIMDQLKAVKKCVSNDNSKCWDSTGEQAENYSPPGRPTAGHAAFVDASGMAWTQISGSMSRIAVDTNGFKKPNQYGKDRFGFYVLGIHNEYSGATQREIGSIFLIKNKGKSINKSRWNSNVASTHFS